MAKRKKRSYRRKKSTPQAPQHALPQGFWAQVGALFLIAFSLILILSWFQIGGPVLDWLNVTALSVIGYATYVVPLIFIYVAVEIFRIEDNRLPFAMRLATTVSIVWFAGLAGLFKNSSGVTTGGFVGDTVNDGLLMLVNSAVAAFVYILLIIITALFILRVSPITVIKKIWEMIRRDISEQEANVKVMRTAAALDTPAKSTIAADFKLNAGVPTIDANDKRQANRASLRNATPRDKVAEAQAALMTVSDPNWVAPSVDILEKKQSPADAGDVQQNAQIIKDTLSEFNIDVEMEGANIGPKVTQYTLKPPSGVKLMIGRAHV